MTNQEKTEKTELENSFRFVAELERHFHERRMKDLLIEQQLGSDEWWVPVHREDN